VTAAKGAAGGRLDAGYAGKVATAIRSNTTFQISSDVDGNPRAIFLVQLRPDCTLISVKLRKSSGLPAWDQAAERGIERTDPFPRPSAGACQPEIEITRGPRDER
jgi:colicin import membrane protein